MFYHNTDYQRQKIYMNIFKLYWYQLGYHLNLQILRRNRRRDHLNLQKLRSRH